MFKLVVHGYDNIFQKSSYNIETIYNLLKGKIVIIIS